MQYKLIPDGKKLQKEFIKFYNEYYSDSFEVFNQFTEQNTELNSNMIIASGLVLESFIIQYFKIALDVLNIESNFSDIKRSFVQRTVYLDYKDLDIPEIWESEYNFSTEEQFLKDATNPDKKLEKYTAFTLFTEKGKRKHKNHNIFHLPKKNEEKDNFITTQGNIISSKEITPRTGFDLTDEFPSKNAIEWNLNYCLYCHKRSKDSCSKGLNEEKQGCPLRQDISESIMLKKERHSIAALAVIMRNNPLCILTGRRICNNCEEACIFQKQEAVDIESLETQILNDVLQMPFGLEIYNTLLAWNPLNIKQSPNLNGKNILVAGLGPAGLAASYFFTKSGANVLGIDALNIEIPEKIQYISKNIIEDISSFLNEPLTDRKPSNIGGVMEYGITARWNKNYLDLLIGLLLRHKNIKFKGSVRIGNTITHHDVFNKYQFNHVVICIGSAKPKVPFYIKGLFNGYSLTKGVLMASDFLMSLHINRKSDFLQKNINEPLYILGCGLTAIDTACEARALLLQNGINNPKVKILYHKEYNKSSAYKVNHLEFKKALEEGIEMVQDVEISEIKAGYLIFKNGESISFGTLIIAIGTEPNRNHVLDFTNKEDVSFFGDCNPQYTGSVVNALASVRDGINDVFIKTLENTNITQNIEEILAKPLIQYEKLEGELYKIIIQSSFLANKINLGNVIKLQKMYENSIALTVCDIKNDTITAYLLNKNDDTQKIVTAIDNKEEIHLNGINCQTFSDIPEDTIIITNKKEVFGKIFPKNQIMLPEDNFSHFIDREFFIAIDDETILSKTLQKVYGRIFLFNKMNCMLGGICGRCIKPDGTYACVKNILDILPKKL